MPDYPSLPTRAFITTYGADTANTRGATVSAPAAQNQKGSWYEIASALTYPAFGFYLHIAERNSLPQDALLDVAIGAAGQEQIIIPDLLHTTIRAPVWVYYFPIYMPAGVRVAARVQSTAADRVFDVVLNTVSAEFMAGYPLGGSVTTYGANAADSGGVTVDPGGTAHTKGAWSEITSATTRPMRQVLIVIGGIANTTKTACTWLIDVGVGASGSETVLLSNLFTRTNTTTDEIAPSIFGPFPVSIPTGTRIAARAQCSIIDASDRLFDMCIYGIE